MYKILSLNLTAILKFWTKKRKILPVPVIRLDDVIFEGRTPRNRKVNGGLVAASTTHAYHNIDPVAASTIERSTVIL